MTLIHADILVVHPVLYSILRRKQNTLACLSAPDFNPSHPFLFLCPPFPLLFFPSIGCTSLCFGTRVSFFPAISLIFPFPQSSSSLSSIFHYSLLLLSLYLSSHLHFTPSNQLSNLNHLSAARSNYLLTLPPKHQLTLPSNDLSVCPSNHLSPLPCNFL